MMRSSPDSTNNGGTEMRKRCTECGRISFEDGLCSHCQTSEIMNLSDDDIADELTRGMDYHLNDWPIREALRRILLNMKVE